MRKNDYLVVYFPIGDHGTKRAVRRFVSRQYGLMQTHIDVVREHEHLICQTATVRNEVPYEWWSRGSGRDPYIVIRGRDLMECSAVGGVENNQPGEREK